ncbi:MAG: TIGR01212 family radical SAM protein, partial [Planctomycetota bacterium]
MPHSLFRSYRAYLQSKFGPGTIRKVTVDGGFSCPNIDGTVGAGGCAYCNNESFSPAFALRRREGIIPVRDQVAAGIKRLAASRKADRFIVYFQPFTNTHAPVDALKRLYDEALDHPAVAGLAVGTRPDCVDEEKLALLENYASRMPVIVEYGLESAHDRTLAALNRGHDFAAFAAAMRLSAGRRFDIGVH